MERFSPENEPGHSQPQERMEENQILSPEQRQRWEAKLAKLQALRLTGNLLTDANAYFEATQISPASLESRFARAYENGDAQTLLEYFEQVASSLNPESVQDDGMREYFTVQREVVRRMIEAAEVK